MTRKILRIVAIATTVTLAATLLFVLTSSKSYNEETESEKWEYKITYPKYSTVNIETTPVEMNIEGAEGWELVSVTSSSNQGTVFYFKRRLR